MSRVIVVGSGITGLTSALRLAAAHEVTVVTKGRLGESTTALAQGGIAGALSPDDSIASHVADTLSAGAGLCDAEAVQILCTEGPERIRELAAAGVDFDRTGEGIIADPLDPASWARGIEGAHSVPRIYHAGGDATGRAVLAALVSGILAEAAVGRIALRTETMLLDLVTEPSAGAGLLPPTGPARGRAPARTTGVRVLADGGVSEVLPADAVVLATGGAGQLFAHTTNPPGATGDGLAAAIRAGVAVRDLEFVQFHPTALAGSGFLVSEAVRGAGALLLDAQGRRFMPRIDPRAELAARNVVALGLHRTMAAQNGLPCHLDARAIPDVAQRFPTIAAALAAQGLSLSADLIPVTPAAHYTMGGVATDLQGRTSLAGLYAVGEVACTGVHGANRLASNSLLEAMVFGVRAARAISADPTGSTELRRPPSPVPDSPRPLSRSALPLSELQALTWTNLGLERCAAGLRTVIDRLGEDPSDSIDTQTAVLERREVETANLTLIAQAMARSALERTESRGAHHRSDAREAAPC